MPIPFQYAVSLRVRHPDTEPALIERALGLKATHRWNRGERRVTPNGTWLDGERDDSYCSFNLAQGADGRLVDHVRAAATILLEAKDFLLELTTSGGSSELYVYWYPNGDTGAVFDPALLTELGGLGLALGINVYEEAAVDAGPPDDLTHEERVLFAAHRLAADLAAKCRTLREMDVSVSATALDDLVNYQMTEFWDQGFSQTEIRAAFAAALDDMNRYAAGQERR